MQASRPSRLCFPDRILKDRGETVRDCDHGVLVQGTPGPLSMRTLRLCGFTRENICSIPGGLCRWDRLVRVLSVVLSQQIFPVIVPVWRSDHGVDMLAIRDPLRVDMSQIGRILVIELNQDDRTVNPIVEG